ncbi:MAG: carbonic anhydrase family protein [Anaerolineales bacterium]
MNTQTKDTLANMTPEKALNLLKEGNQRFVSKKKEQRDLLEQVAQTSAGQYPFAVVLGCVDSRVPLELVFDLGIGDIFGVRIAGNISNEDILGSMEFATKVVGSKHILVLGHTSCGAVKGAYDAVELGNLTGLVNKIKPAVEAVGPGGSVDEIAQKNVELTIEEILHNSPILKEMVDQGEIGISGGMYDVSTGKVTFL